MWERDNSTEKELNYSSTNKKDAQLLFILNAKYIEEIIYLENGKSK